MDGKQNPWCAIKLTQCLTNACKYKSGCNNVTFEDGTYRDSCYEVPDMHSAIDSGICANWDYCENSKECTGNNKIVVKRK